MKTTKNITVIPATLNLHTRLSKATVTHRRVASYARVSTDSEEQLNSYKAQLDCCTTYIRSYPDREFVEDIPMRESLL